MKCVEVERLLDQFVGDELDFAVRRKIDSHLHECAECRSEAENLQNAARLLKNLPLIAPSNQLDARVMQAFRTHQETQNQPNFWTAVLNRFSISKPALACATLVLIVFTASAFQLGRISAPNNTMANNKSADSTAPTVQIIEKRIEVPIVKTVEIPIYREKIISRIVYRNRAVNSKTTYAARKISNFDSPNTTATFIQTRGETFAPVNLMDFQPVSEIKISIIKGGENER